MYWLQEERLKCCIRYISHSDILNLSLFANSIYCTHLSWTWKPPSMANSSWQPRIGNNSVKPAASTMLHYAMVFYLSFSASAKQHSMLGTGHFPSTFDNLSYISVQSSILWWFWSGQQASASGPWKFHAYLGQHFLPPFLGIPPTVRPRGWWHHVDLSSWKSIPPMLDGICRPSWSKLKFHAQLILGKITSFKHGFRFVIVLQHAVPVPKRSGISQLAKLLWGAKGEPFEICSWAVPSTKLASGNSACKASFNTPASMNKTASRDSFVRSGRWKITLDERKIYWRTNPFFHFP